MSHTAPRAMLARVLLAVVATVALAACSSSTPTPAPTTQAPATTAAPLATTPAASISLKVGLLPIVDSIPFHVAAQNGYFREEGVEVELVTFASARDRDVALQAREVDAVAADLIAPALLNNGQDRVRVVKEVTRSYPNGIRISIVAAAGSGIQSAADLRGKRVGISHNTIIEYVLDMLLRNAGISPEEVQKEEVTAIPLRMELLSKGQIDAAVLPEPLTTLATMQGARAILDDGASPLLVGTLVVRNDVLQGQRNAVRGLVAAHDRAVAEVNTNPQAYRHLLTEKASLPEVLKDTFPVPIYPQRKVPGEEDVSQVVTWMVGAGLLSRPLSYEELVDPTLLP